MKYGECGHKASELDEHLQCGICGVESSELVDKKGLEEYVQDLRNDLITAPKRGVNKELNLQP